jgi:hypothetical protein
MRTGAIMRALRDSAGWWAALLAGTALTLPLTLAETAVWQTLNAETGPVLAVLIILAGTMIMAVAAGAAFGRIRLSGKMTAYQLTYPLRMAPWKARELLAGGHPGNGRRNRRYPDEGAFIADDPRRRPRSAGGGDQCDYGVRWRGSQRGGHRLTWIEDTGELIAVTPVIEPAEDNPGGARRYFSHVREGPIELIARIPSQAETERCLRDWPYADHDLRWVRRRAHGWNVPVPPRGKYWQYEDNKPPTPWPAPPPPSVGRAEGAYVGTHTPQGNAQVTITDAEGTRPLYHYVGHSPTGYSWGYGGDGPHDLARSILYDRLGYVPCQDIYSQFCADIVANLPGDFTLTYKEVDAWIARHGKLFARNPRAEPFDPYTYGGA